MITPIVQRWRARRDSYRLAGEPICTSAYEVALIREDAIAKAFIQEHHYSGTFPAARYRVGLYRAGALVGVAVASVPVNNLSLACLPCPAAEAAELGRLVLLDDVPANGETWFLGRVFELLRSEGLAGLISFADPVPRSRLDGALVFPGHVGTIYQAHNAVYRGLGTGRTLRLLPDGQVFSARAEAKIRRLDRGWRYAAAQLERAGAAPLEGDPCAWLRTWLPRVTRPLRHPGNHKYLWGLDRTVRRHLPPGQPFPKFQGRSAA